jgi:hypothetical protein
VTTHINRPILDYCSRVQLMQPMHCLISAKPFFQMLHLWMSACGGQNTYRITSTCTVVRFDTSLSGTAANGFDVTKYSRIHMRSAHEQATRCLRLCRSYATGVSIGLATSVTLTLVSRGTLRKPITGADVCFRYHFYT